MADVIQFEMIDDPFCKCKHVQGYVELGFSVPVDLQNTVSVEEGKNIIRKAFKSWCKRVVEGEIEL